MSLNLDAFKDKHVGQRAYIIGKGPSLDNLMAVTHELQTGVIFALNEAIHAAETNYLPTFMPKYCVQQDSELTDRCVPKVAKHLMNDWQHTPESKVKRRVAISPWNPKAILYRAPEWKLSAVVALDIAKLMGCTAVTFVCFDSWLNAFTGPDTYAKCVNYHRNGSNHRANGIEICAHARELFSTFNTCNPVVPGLV